MKTKIYILILALVTLISNSWAQPIITGVVIGPQGSKTMAYPIPGTIIPGTTGANQIWDYANIVHDPTSYYLKNVSFGGLSKAIRDAFPTGNLANEYVLNGTLVATMVFRIEAADLLYLGLNTTVFPVPDIQLVFPHSYQKTLAGFTYDAYGTLKTPFGTYNNAVRLRENNGSKHKYDYWQFDPYYILLMEYQIDTITHVISDKAFFKTEIATSVNELETKNELKIFPNPAVDVMNIQTSFTGNKTVEIYDISGKKIMSRIVSLKPDSPSELDVSRIKRGIYLVKINEGTQIYSKIVELQ